VKRVHTARRGDGAFEIAEEHGVHVLERAFEAPQRVGLRQRVLIDAVGDEGVGFLQKRGARAGEKEQLLAVDAPHHRRRAVNARAWIANARPYFVEMRLELFA
jgi:hypothetical protein